MQTQKDDLRKPQENHFGSDIKYFLKFDEASKRKIIRNEIVLENFDTTFANLISANICVLPTYRAVLDSIKNAHYRVGDTAYKSIK